ncbi:MAG: tryptophan synthase subunit alpha [Tepidisphaeraceae bacterium]
MTRLSLSETFAQLRQKNQIALMPFIPAGYPDLETTAKCLPALEAAGASIIEIGIPFSDPIADGPVIQEAFGAALAKKLKLADVFATIKKARPTVSIPLVAMVSYSIAHRIGIDKFVEAAREAGFDGLILPDLPPPEAEAICQRVRAGGMETILLVAPTTPRQRRIEIGRLSSGFVYYLSVTGITGERTDLPRELADGVRDMKSLTARPVCVGFGVSTATHVATLQGVADGAIVGSAVVRRMQQNQGKGPDAIATAVGQYCRELLSDVR